MKNIINQSAPYISSENGKTSMVKRATIREPNMKQLVSAGYLSKYRLD